MILTMDHEMDLKKTKYEMAHEMEETVSMRRSWEIQYYLKVKHTLDIGLL